MERNCINCDHVKDCPIINSWVEACEQPMEIFSFYCSEYKERRMVMDLKGMYQEKAEEMALEKYNTEFEHLPEHVQDKVYTDAMDIVWQNAVAAAEALTHDRIHGQGRVGRE